MNAVLWTLSPFVLALCLAKPCAAFGRRAGLVDQPRADRFAERTTPRLGGVIIALALLPLTAHLLSGGGAGNLYPSGLMGFAVAFLVGLIDDVAPLHAWAKLGGQGLAAIISVAWLARVVPPNGPVETLPTWLVAPVGVVWIVGFQNAINFLDNMDGIAGGLVAIGLTALSFAFAGIERTLPLAIALACAGFLPWNVARPARLFLGDAGSLPLGHALGFVSLAAVWTAPTLGGAAAAIIVVLVPVLDISFVTITRLRRGENPAIGGRDHTTHRIYARLGSASLTMGVFWLVALFLAAASVWMRTLPTASAVLVLVVVAAAFVLCGVRVAALPEPSAAPRD